MAIKHLAGDRIIGTAAERAALSGTTPDTMEQTSWKELGKTTLGGGGTFTPASNVTVRYLAIGGGGGGGNANGGGGGAGYYPPNGPGLNMPSSATNGGGGPGAPDSPTSPGVAGINGLGGGGGGAGNPNPVGGGNGGDGMVILRYAV